MVICFIVQTKTVTAEGCYAKNRPVLGERQAEWRCAHLIPAMLTSVTPSFVKAAQGDKMISQNVQMIFPRTNFMMFLWDSFEFSGELYEKDRK